MDRITRAANRELNLGEYQRGEVRLVSRPRFLIIELTQGCNLKCPMCRPQAITTRQRSMNPQLFARIVDELVPSAELIDLRGWGESLILPDIANHIATVARLGTRIRFVTNLAFRRDDVLEVLATHDCQVAVSVDSADPHLFAELRGGANLERVSENLDRLVAAYRRHQGSSKSIYVTTTVQRPALPNLPDLIDFVADRGIEEIRMFSVSIAQGDPLSLDGAADVDEVLVRCATRARRRGVKLFAGTRLGSMACKSPEEDACTHPWAYVYFAYDGRVGFCDHLIGPDGERYLLGDLRNSSFEQIWNGDAWQTLRREHLSTRDPSAPFFEECHWCYRNRFVDFEHVFFPETEKARREL